MKKVLITGANGFIGKNLCEALTRRDDINIIPFGLADDWSVLESGLKVADYVYHLAGINRPKNVKEFESGNVGFTEKIIRLLCEYKRNSVLIFSSSTQAELDNAYGRSKKKAEELVLEYGRKTNAPVFVYRLANVFGRWCKPNSNSVIATFCYNISRGLDIRITDKNYEIVMVYVDDVVSSFVSHLDGLKKDTQKYLPIEPVYKIKLGDLADKLYAIRDIRKTLVIPSLKDKLTRYLYSTYTSYLDKRDFLCPLDVKKDSRGSLAELIKSEHFGQMFVSTTFGHVTRGNHYHNTKIEKFCVIKGHAAIKFRHIFEDEVITYNVSGDDLVVVDIPPGYTHSIENLSDDEMIVLFWADQIFDPQRSDTYSKGV